MKHFQLAMVLLVILTFIGCLDDNRAIFVNTTSARVIVNMRGELISVPTGRTVARTDLPRGTYEYSTTVGIPAGAKSVNLKEDLGGQLTFKGNTRTTVVYSAFWEDSTYVVGATISSSDPTTVGPVSP